MWTLKQPCNPFNNNNCGDMVMAASMNSTLAARLNTFTTFGNHSLTSSWIDGVFNYCYVLLVTCRILAVNIFFCTILGQPEWTGGSIVFLVWDDPSGKVSRIYRTAKKCLKALTASAWKVLRVKLAAAESFSRQFCLVSALYDFSCISHVLVLALCSSVLARWLYLQLWMLLVSALYDFSFIACACFSALTLSAAMTSRVSTLYDFRRETK